MEFSHPSQSQNPNKIPCVTATNQPIRRLRVTRGQNLTKSSEVTGAGDNILSKPVINCLGNVMLFTELRSSKLWSWVEEAFLVGWISKGSGSDVEALMMEVVAGVVEFVNEDIIGGLTNVVLGTPEASGTGGGM